MHTHVTALSLYPTHFVFAVSHNFPIRVTYLNLTCVNQDVDQAYMVCLDDDDVDCMNRMVYDKVKEEIKKQPDKSGLLYSIFS